MQEIKPNVAAMPPEGMQSIYTLLISRGVRFNRRHGKFAPDHRKHAQAIENNDLIARFNFGEQWCAKEGA